MLISYPVLPARPETEAEDAYLERILNTHVLSSEGRFPVSTIPTTKGPIHRWHGGIHIQGLGEPIRAMADGTVVAFRFAKQAETYEGLGQYDTSFVLIRHDTQTGESTSVAFYSLYMQLANRDALLPDRYQQLPPWLRSPACTPGPAVQKPSNLKVWRKDVLGFAGKLYDKEACHIEIFTTQAGLSAFWRDSTSVKQGAGSADFYGDAHFVIPANRDFAVRHPRAAEVGAHRIDFPGKNDFALPLGTAGRNTQALHVCVKLDKGQRIATSHVLKPDGSYEQLGAPVVQENYEYELFQLATALYPDCPSAGLEWLRFGRVLGSDATTRNENWQLVRYSETAEGYIDLAPEAIVKLSDADFVHWQGWEKREEGQAAKAADGICDDERTIKLCQGADDASRIKARHLVCKAPSEWDASDLAARYGRLREPGAPFASDAAWQKFEDHVKKMAFWTEAGLGERSVWHFHPMQFVRHFRKSGWLSQSELLQLVPSHAIRTGKHVMWEPVNLPPTKQDTDLVVAHRVPLNKALRKYNICSPLRQVAFFGNAVQETSWLSTLAESGGQGLWYSPWYGRGFLQLTNPENYCDYWAWRGRKIDAKLRTAVVDAYKKIAAKAPGQRTNTELLDGNFAGMPDQWETWRKQVQAGHDPLQAEDRVAPADSAGFYWHKMQMSTYADKAHVIERKSVATNQGGKVYYRSPVFWQASAAVNLPASINKTYSQALNGFDSRCCAFGVAVAVLTEIPLPDSTGATTLRFPEGYTKRAP